jgi:hypothetical protein
MNWRSHDWVMKANHGVQRLGKAGLRLVPVAISAAVLFVAAQSMPACSTSAPAGEATTGTGPGTTTSTTSPTHGSTACDHPSPGCACSTKGATAECGKVIIRSGVSFQCEMGTTTCDGATWGACDGSIKVTSGVISGGGVALQGLGRAMSCGSTDPCDPNCFVTTDTPPGIDAGSGISAIDGGLVIANPAGLNTCNLASNPGTLYGALSGAYAQNPAAGSCTGGASDDCNYDFACSAATNGTCGPYADGTTNTSCTTTPDFTAGLGCWDSSSATGLELQVCNRGGVTASTGTLLVAIESGSSPTTSAAGCPTNIVTGPALGTTSQNNGTCSIPLGTVPIGPGECVSFNVDTPPSGVTCKSVTGSALGGMAGLSGNIFAVVNPPQSMTGVAPLNECDSCNNFTAVNSGEIPSGNPLTGPGACVQSWCGVSPTSTTTGGCPANSPTSITGTVKDPGGNVGLSNVAVYVATTAPTVPLQDPEPNAMTGEPYCDTCASLSTAGYSNGVATDVNGNFTLYVNPGTYTVVAQLGRWRRISTVTATACSSNPQTNNLWLPQNRTQGDIPKMAIVEGSGESAECWLAKVGISDSEFAPYASGNVNRIDLYNTDDGNTSYRGLNYYNAATNTYTTPPSATTLWGNGAANTLPNYAAVLMPCDLDFNYSTASVAAQTAVAAYTNAGGRIFMDHWWGARFLENGTSTGWNSNNVATWQHDTNGYSNYEGTVLDTSSDQTAMYAWLAAWDNMPDGPGHILSAAPRDIAVSTGSASTELISFPTFPAVASFWFNTPTTAMGTMASPYCGRAVFNDMHVSASRAADLSGGGTQMTTFPGTCQSSPLTSEELALEYEFFQLSACSLGASNPTYPPPPPPPPPPLQPETYTRIFEANCPTNFPVKWGFFEWQDQMPSQPSPVSGASISFSVQTAMTAMGGGPGAWGPSVALGSTTASTSGTWATTMNSVDTALTMAGQTSQTWLAVSMTLSPNTPKNASPVLETWQQLFDCIP